MKVEVLQDADDELSDAIARYEEIEPGLGVRLKEEVRAAILWIAANPEIPRLRPKGYRRVNLKIFPYFVAYFIWILAVAHGHRRPEYWLKRKMRIT
jgi:hypothetical protein